MLSAPEDKSPTNSRSYPGLPLCHRRTSGNTEGDSRMLLSLQLLQMAHAADVSIAPDQVSNACPFLSSSLKKARYDITW